MLRAVKDSLNIIMVIRMMIIVMMMIFDDGKVVRERQVQRSVLMETITATTRTRLLKSDPLNHLV